MSKILVASIKGPKGDTGDITPELEAARDTATAAASSASLSRDSAAASAAEAAEAATVAVAEADIPAQVAAGITDSPTVTAAAQAAAVTAVDAEIAGRDLVEQEVMFESDLAVAMVDEQGRRTWLESDLAGAPTPYAASKITDRVAKGVGTALGVVDQNTDVSELAFVVVDAQGRRTELEVGRDGRFTARVVASLQARMSLDTTVPTKAGANVLLAGHSMLAGAASAIVARLSAVTVTSLAVGGETSRAIAARQGGQPVTFLPAGGSIPASGSVDVALVYADGGAAWPLLQGATSYAGTVRLQDGTSIPGTFSIIRDPAATAYVHHAGDRYTFTRTNAGAARTIVGTVPFIYDVAVPRRSDIFVIWAGRNNFAETDQVIADTQAMILHQYALDRRFVVLSEHNSSTAVSGSTEWTQVKTLNDRQRALWGRRFIDARRYLIDYGLAHAGITPTTQDLADIANDVVPSSLRSDNLHLNATGSGIVADLIKARLIELGWY